MRPLQYMTANAVGVVVAVTFRAPTNRKFIVFDQMKRRVQLCNIKLKNSHGLRPAQESNLGRENVGLIRQNLAS